MSDNGDPARFVALRIMLFGVVLSVIGLIAAASHHQFGPTIILSVIVVAAVIGTYVSWRVHSRD